MSTKTPYVVTNSSSGTNSANPPFFSSITPFKVTPSSTTDHTIFGSFFNVGTTVTIVGQTVNSVTFVSDNEIMINVTSSSTDGTYDLEINNGQSVVVSDVFVVETSVWSDLRAGNTYSSGNASGLDIRVRAGMTMSQDANGMFFSGSNPWSSWAKFEFLQWTRGEGKTCQWVMTTPTSAMMIGIGSTATNETSTTQYYQAEVEAYFQNSTTLWGLFGNNGTPGGAGNQSQSTSVTGYAALKVKFENDGNQGDTFTLYGLNSTSPSDWDDETNVIVSFAIGGSLNPDETDIMPFIIPRTDSQRFIAVKVE